MIKRSFIILAFAFVLGLAHIEVSAQGQVLRAEIPFEFTVGKKTLPAGGYIVKLAETGSSRLVTLRKADGEGFAMAMTNGVSSKGAETTNGLVFVRSGDKYVLHQVHTPGREIGQQIVQPRRIEGVELARSIVELKPTRGE